jgi:hypothetical protein
MSKLSSRDIQMCVAGAFALMGFYAFYWLPYYIFTARDIVLILSHVITALALPLGIGIVLGSAQAIVLTRIYLWLEIICGCIAIPVFCFVFPKKAMHLILQSGPDLAICIILLSLIIWSGSRRFRHESDA